MNIYKEGQNVTSTKTAGTEQAWFVACTEESGRDYHTDVIYTYPPFKKVKARNVYCPAVATFFSLNRQLCTSRLSRLCRTAFLTSRSLCGSGHCPGSLVTHSRVTDAMKQVREFVRSQCFSGSRRRSLTYSTA